MRTMERNKFLLEEIKKLKGEHPFWGYRKVWAYLRYREGLNINKKRIYRLMKKNNLLVTKNNKLKAKRAKFPYKSKPKPIRPNQIWGIDMTKILIQNAGWMYLQLVLDWFTKKIVGYSLSFTSKTGDWLDAFPKDPTLLENSAFSPKENLPLAENSQFPMGIRDSLKENLYLVSDKRLLTNFFKIYASL